MRQTPDIQALPRRAAQALPQPNPSRDHRIDVIRGLVLVMIFINHVPGTVFGQMTNQNFGFSDSAEVFVLLAGVSAALAYGSGLSLPRIRPAVMRIWRRAWTLYLVHLMVSLLALGIVAAMARWGGSAKMILMDNFAAVLTDPLDVFIGLPLMLHQFGYVNILPLYVLLLLVAPFAIWLGLRRPVWLLVVSVVIWMLAGLSRFNITTYPGGNGWFLNPLSWQLLFVLGLLTGLRLKQGERWVPVHPVLIGLAAGYVVLSLLWVKVPAVTDAGTALLSALADIGVPRLFTHFDKGHAELPRLLHVLALAYLVSLWPWFRQHAGSPAFGIFALLGRHGLPVFALGTVLSFVARALRELWETAGYAPSVPLDAVILLAGVALQLALAAGFEVFGKAAQKRPARPGLARGETGASGTNGGQPRLRPVAS